MSHPCPFSREVIDGFERIILREWPTFMGRPVFHDPWAGPGERLGELAKRLFLCWSGTEIEETFIVHPGVMLGDSTDPTTYPWHPSHRNYDLALGWGWVVITSPVYPNGMADNYARLGDVRRTYKQSIAEAEGAVRDLHENNMGQYGYRGTDREGRSLRRKRYWDLADRSVVHWASARMALVNVSDFIHSNGDVEPVITDWVALLERHGWKVAETYEVATRGYRNGANRDARTDGEVILVAVRA